METNLSQDQFDELLNILKLRFEKNRQRHPHVLWNEVAEKLVATPEKWLSLYKMEHSGGEPDIVSGIHGADHQLYFVDCSPETPSGRRSLCYDKEARVTRKKHPPENSALEMAEAMGMTILDEDGYRYLQTIGAFDQKSSSWIFTPERIRTLGGALFGDCRYQQTFVYHNGADSYYSSRGFRGFLRI